jgi:hypothetical protein
MKYFILSLIGLTGCFHVEQQSIPVVPNHNINNISVQKEPVVLLFLEKRNIVGYAKPVVTLSLYRDNLLPALR